MSPAQLALQETRAKVPEDSDSTPVTYLVQLHLVGREVIPLELCDSPGRYTLTTQLRYDSTQSREADWMGLDQSKKHFTYVFSGAV